jgi:hypothetical protein
MSVHINNKSPLLVQDRAIDMAHICQQLMIHNKNSKKNMTNILVARGRGQVNKGFLSNMTNILVAHVRGQVNKGFLKFTASQRSNLLTNQIIEG